MSIFARAFPRAAFYAHAISGLLIAGVCLPLAAQSSSSTGTSPVPAPPYSATFSSVGFTFGQTIRLNLLNIQSGVIMTPATPCSVVASFLDAGGNVIKSKSLTVAPGESVAYDLGASDLLTPIAAIPARAEMRAAFTVPAPVVTPVSSTATSTSTISSCLLFPSVEVFDNVSGVDNVYTTRHRILPLALPVSDAKP